ANRKGRTGSAAIYFLPVRSTRLPPAPIVAGPAVTAVIKLAAAAANRLAVVVTAVTSAGVGLAVVTAVEASAVVAGTHSARIGGIAIATPVRAPRDAAIAAIRDRLRLVDAQL